MKRVLLPIDGSECSLRGVQYILNKRADRSSPADPEMHLVNVQIPLSGQTGQFINREQIAGFQRDEGARALLGELVPALSSIFFDDIRNFNARFSRVAFVDREEERGYE